MLFCFTSGSEQDAHRGNRNQPRQRAENRHDHSVCPTAFLYWRTAPMGRDKAVFGCVVSDLRARRLMSGAHRRRGSRFLWGIPVFRSVDMDVGGNWSRAPRRRGFSRIKIGIRHERTPCPRQQRLRSAQVPRQDCSRPIASARHPKPPAIEVDARIRARPAISTWRRTGKSYELRRHRAWRSARSQGYGAPCRRVRRPALPSTPSTDWRSVPRVHARLVWKAQTSPTVSPD